MSGIDKLCFEVPHTNAQGNRAGFTLQYIIERARQNGLMHYQRWFSQENKPAIAFMDTGRSIDGCLVGYMGRGSEAIMTRIEINPSCFSSFESLWEFLERTGLMEFPNCIATRIDVAADYSTPFVDLIRGFDVSERSNTKVYFDQRAGFPRTVYFGANKDILLVYDKEFEQRNRSPAYAPNVRTRIERQLRSKQLIRQHFGHDIRLGMLVSVLYNLCLEGPDLFESVSLSDITFRPDNLYSPPQLARRYQMEGMLKLASYANTRRFINTAENGNFIRDWRSLCDMTPLPEEQQPSAVFRAALREYAEVPYPTANSA